MENRDLWILAMTSVVAIVAIVVLSLSFTSNISGSVPKNVVPIPIELLSPADGAVVSTTATLDWTRTRLADFVILYVDDERGFSTPLVQEFQLRKNERAFTVPEGVLESGKTYHWRVVAYNQYGASNSATWSFTTE